MYNIRFNITRSCWQLQSLKPTYTSSKQEEEEEEESPERKKKKESNEEGS